eukprot:1561620-Pyramimonas_sp.AAC.1
MSGVIFDTIIAPMTVAFIMMASEQTVACASETKATGKGRALGPPRIYAMGGLTKGLLTYGDSLGVQSHSDLQTARAEHDGHSVEQKYELILFCRQGKVYQKERRRNTFATRD